MKRYITYYLSIILALSVFTSCEGEVFQIAFESKEDNVLTLRISTDKLTSRATIDGEDANNENLINTLDCFFYISATDSAVCRKTVSGLSYKGSDIHEISIPFDDDEMKELFGSNYKTAPARNECLVYVIANLPSGVTVWNEATIKSLKERTLAGSFTQSDKITVNEIKKKVSKIQTNFVMDSDGVDNDDDYDVVTLTVDNNLASLSGHVPLYRAAAKVGLFVYVPESIRNGEGNNQTIWSPVPGSMEVKFHNGLKKGNIDNTTTPYTTIIDDDYFVTDRIYFDVTDSEVTANGITYNQTTSVPFYTYPTSVAKGTYFTLYLSWEEMQETTNNEGETVLTGKGVFKNCFYQIPINKLEALVRNNYYRLLLNVGVLGTESGMVELTPSYTVCEWNTEDINTKIEENVYLVVQEHDVTINNKNSYAVEYASSHDIEVQIISITQPNYSQEIEGTSVFCDYEQGQGLPLIRKGTDGLYRDCRVSVSGNTIVLDHNVVNRGEETTSGEYDIAPYTIIVYVKMVYGEDDDDYYDDIITYTQYPSMYAEAKYNGDDTNRGNVWVYNNNNNESDDADWLAVRGANDGAGPGSNTNTNHNMYVIYVSALSPEDPYFIGDTRDLNSPIKGSDLSIGDEDSQKQTLQNYYATRTDEKNIIAPIFRMASSHGKLEGSGLTYQLAKRRCAAYQEDGYPAGRWRMPTYAELKYIAKLSSDGKIPHLYSNGKNYWTATARCTYANNADDINADENYSTTAIAYVRCVYDEWYWGSGQLSNKDQFTWGDE